MSIHANTLAYLRTSVKKNPILILDDVYKFVVLNKKGSKVFKEIISFLRYLSKKGKCIHISTGVYFLPLEELENFPAAIEIIYG